MEFIKHEKIIRGMCFSIGKHSRAAATTNMTVILQNKPSFIRQEIGNFACHNLNITSVVYRGVKRSHTNNQFFNVSIKTLPVIKGAYIFQTRLIRNRNGMESTMQKFHLRSNIGFGPYSSLLNDP